MYGIINHIWESTGFFRSSFLIMLYLHLFHIKKRKEQKIENREYQRMIKRQKQYFDRMVKSNTGVRMFRHDIENQLFCLKRFLENGNIDGGLEYLQGILRDYEKVGVKVETGNYILNIVAEDIIKEEDNIAIEWNGCFPERTKIKDTDLSVLFANLLKNAKEEIMDMSDKKIAVSVQLLNGAVFVACQNAVNKTRIRSGKKEGRGLGLKKVREIVKRYNGEIKIENGEEFIIRLLFYDIMI